MRNAAAPIIGGIIWPPVDATASMAPATLREYPPSRMRGIVITPVDATLDTALPEIEPKRPDATTAIFADPPRECPISAAAKSVKYSDPPERSNT